LNLAQQAGKEEEIFLPYKLKPGFPEEMRIRAEALRFCQSEWSADNKSYQECQKKWKTEMPAAFELRDELLHMKNRCLHCQNQVLHHKFFVCRLIFLTAGP